MSARVGIPPYVFLVVNIDPGENAFPSREQELDTQAPDVADIFFGRAF